MTNYGEAAGETSPAQKQKGPEGGETSWAAELFACVLFVLDPPEFLGDWPDCCQVLSDLS